jgi:ABC-type branched-subunit amino acid transport system ATPase component
MAQREVEALPPILESVRAHLRASIVLVEHDMPFVLRMSDRIVAMAKGSVIASGSPAAVLSNPAVVESYLGDQWQQADEPPAKAAPAARRTRKKAVTSGA